MRMTYPIHPGPFFRTAPNWGRPAKHSLPQTFFEQDRRIYCPLSSLAAASRHLDEIHLIYGPLDSILFDQGFPVEYELEEFNPPHTTSPPSLVMSTATQNFAQTSSYFIPRQHFLETFTVLSPKNQDRTSMGDYIIPVLNQRTRPLLT